MKKISLFLGVAFLVSTIGVSVQADQGVTDNKIVLGAHMDLSGPLAAWGVAATNGMKLRFKEANDAGGIHGRKIEFLVEDDRYQVPLAVQATNMLINRDKVFAMVGSLGTAQNNAAIPIQIKANVPNLFPFTAAESMAVPLEKLKFNYFTNYKKQVVAGVQYFAETQNAKSVCLQVQATDYGQELEEGFSYAVKKYGLEVKYVGRHKTTETEFVGTATAISNAGCDFLYAGTAVKDTILLYTSLRKLGWDRPVISTMVPYLPLVAEAAGMNGLYATPAIYAPDFINHPEAKKFSAAYRAAYDTEATNQSQTGYIFADLTVKALEKAGRNLTVDSFVKALESIDNYLDPFGTSAASYDSRNHQGGNRVTLVQIKDNKWVMLKESIPFDL